MWNMPMYGEWGWAGMAVMMVMFWVPVLALIFWITSQTSRRQRQSDRGTSDVSAKELLSRRYASGEVTREQYLQMVSDLDDTHAANGAR